MCQALAAAVAAAVNVLELCVAQKDGMVIRQWVSIGMLMHEVSLLSTFGKEMRMIGDMSMALQYLNLRLKLVRSRASQKDAGELPRKETFFDNAASPTQQPKRRLCRWKRPCPQLGCETESLPADLTIAALLQRKGPDFGTMQANPSLGSDHRTATNHPSARSDG